MGKLTRYSQDMDGSMVPDPDGDWMDAGLVIELLANVTALLQDINDDHDYNISDNLSCDALDLIEYALNEEYEE